MAYSTQDDILKTLSERELIQLTDDEGTGQVDAAVVSQAIEDADAVIDAHLQGRYTVPLSPVPKIIRQASVDIAIFNLYSRKRDTCPEIRKDRYKEKVRFLERAAEGKVKLGADEPAEDPDTGPQVTTSKSDRVFSTGKGSDGSSGTLDNY